MAIVHPKAICKICEKEIGNNISSNNVVGLPEGISILSGFSMFNDSVIHQSCFKNWEKAESFVRSLNNQKNLTINAVILKNGKLKIQ